MSLIKRWLNRKKPFVCKLCGFTVPIIGTRQDQAALAIDHMEDIHPIYYELGAKRPTMNVVITMDSSGAAITHNPIFVTMAPTTTPDTSTDRKSFCDDQPHRHHPGAKHGGQTMSDAETIMGETGIIYVCAECGTPVESEPCKKHQPSAYLAGFLAWAKPGARCKVPGFEDWIATPYNGWRQEETGWLVTHGFLADLMVESGFRYDFEADDPGIAPRETKGDNE